MTEFRDVLGKASRPTTVVSLCLDGEALGEIRALEHRIDEGYVPMSLADRNPASDIVEQIEAIQERAKESYVDFHLRAVRGPDWAPFWSGRPVPGEGESSEAFNVRWFDFVCRMVSLTCVDPVMTPEQVAELVDEMPADSWGELSEEVWALNTNKVTVPFSAAASAQSQNSGATSRRLSDSGSPSASSGEPKPARKRRTTTKTAKPPAAP
ncbi:MAG: hypothetical protein M3N43_13410 [Actinomycetota bacterium]|nr:hypothetical protein [Actinomycetota bacterium]